MKRKGGPDNEYSMCVLGIRKPTCKEAEEFFPSRYNNDFDMEKEETMPVFGK